MPIIVRGLRHSRKVTGRGLKGLEKELRCSREKKALFELNLWWPSVPDLSGGSARDGRKLH